ncbi:MAG TPA: lipoyl(octanoyl) transferase LipB [Gemmatimonadaceae bacterium]
MKLAVVDLGTMAYGAALELQRAAAHARISAALPDDVLLLVEHPPVVTLGRGTKPGHLMASEAQLRARGVELFDVERGGDITFHGPGQLVGYPIIDLKAHRQDLHWYLRQVEEAIIQAMASIGLPCERNHGYTGVWTRGVSNAAASRLRKVASIGVHARDWVTWHGFALNVTTDLSYFDLMVPCGINDVTMTTVQRELGAEFPGESAVKKTVVDSFAAVFGMDADPRSAQWLEGVLAVMPASPMAG